MNHVDVTEDAYDAYRAWAQELWLRGQLPVPDPADNSLIFPFFFINAGTPVVTNNIRIGNTTADHQFIARWNDNTTNVGPIDATVFGDTTKTFLVSSYSEI